LEFIETKPILIIAGILFLTLGIPLAHSLQYANALGTGCHVNLLTLDASSFSSGQTLTGTGTFVGESCAEETVYFWIVNPAGNLVYTGATQGTANSPYTYTVNWKVLGGAGFGYELVTSLCPFSLQSKCPELFSGVSRVPFSIPSTGIQIYQIILQFESQGAPISNVSTVIDSGSTGAEVAGGESNATGIIVVSLPSGSYRIGYFPSDGSYLSKGDVFTVASTSETVIILVSETCD